MRRSLLIGASLAVLALLGIVAIYALTHINTKMINPQPQAITSSTGVKLDVTAVTFHEGFRAPGKKAVDVEITLRGVTDEHYEEGRIVSITGTSGKIYNTDEGPRNIDTIKGIQKITAFRDVDDNETNIVSIVFRENRTGKEIEIPIRGIQPQVTHK